MGDSEIIMCVTLPQSDMAMGEILIVFFFFNEEINNKFPAKQCLITGG